MPRPVTNDEIELASPQLLSVSGTASTLSATRLGRAKRTFFSIIPVTAGVTVTIVFGEQIAVVNAGVPVGNGQAFTQSLDSNGRGVFQGAIQAIASGAGSVALTETFEVE